MPHTWIAANTDGYDLEDLPTPRRVTDVCPACTRKVILVERELVQNLRVLGVPLVATARAGAVFQCEHCGTCFEPPPVGFDRPEAAAGSADPGSPGPAAAAALATLERQLRDAEDEAALWRMRMDLATRKREPELAREARGLIDRYAAVAETLRGEIAALRSRPGASPAATPVASLPVEDELVALRRRVAERAAEKAAEKAAAPSPPEAPPTPQGPEAPKASETPAPPPAPSPEDELAALKRRLQGDRPAPTPTAPPAAPKPPPGPPGPEAGPEDEMAALKRKLRGK